MERKEQVIVRANGGEIRGLAQIERAADYIVKSKLFGVQTKEQAVALMLLAQAEGIHPMKAVQEYHIIQGRPAMKADAMLARFLQAGGKVEWHELNDKVAKATFSHPQGGTVTIEWTIEMAEKAGLTGKDNWKKFPRAMLRARVISEGVRTVYPAVATGIYTPEEIMDFEEVQEPTPQPVEAQGEVIEAEYTEVKQQKRPKQQAKGPEKVQDDKERLKLARAIKEMQQELGLTDQQLVVMCHKAGVNWVKTVKDLRKATKEELLAIAMLLESKLGPAEEQADEQGEDDNDA